MDVTCSDEASENSLLFILNVGRHPHHSAIGAYKTERDNVTFSGKTNPLGYTFTLHEFKFHCIVHVFLIEMLLLIL